MTALLLLLLAVLGATAVACGQANPRGKPGVLASRGGASPGSISWEGMRARDPALSAYHVVQAASEGNWWGLGDRAAIEFLVKGDAVRAVRLRLPDGVGAEPPVPDWRLNLPATGAPRWESVRAHNGAWRQARALAPFAPGIGVRWGWPGYGLRALVDHAGVLVGVEAVVPTGEGWSPAYEEAPGETLQVMGGGRAYAQRVLFRSPADIR